MNPPRNTNTGGVLEQMVLPALVRGGYAYKMQVTIGQRLGCGKHKVDAVAERAGKRLLISMKWQQSSGTAEQKVPFEVICLLEALENGDYEKAYLVLGGGGWTLRELYTSGGIDKYLHHSKSVKIITLEDFVALANSGEL